MQNVVDYSVVDLFWKEAKSFENNGNTIYQIYGDHLIYGKKALLYIGISIDYLRRQKEHEDWINYERNVESYFAEVSGDQDVLKEIETLLIFTHSPTYNSQKLLWNEDYENSKLIVRNYGLKGDLLPEISYRYWTDFYKYGGWNKIAKPSD